MKVQSVAAIVKKAKRGGKKLKTKQKVTQERFNMYKNLHLLSPKVCVAHWGNDMI